MMKNVIIDFLDEEGHLDGSFLKAQECLAAYPVFNCATTLEVYLKLEELNTNREPLIITFLGHGNIIQLGKYIGATHCKLMFSELLPALNNCRTKFPLYVNMIANCDSYGIAKYLNYAPKIDEFWVTLDKTRSISKACVAIKDEGNSDIFLENKESETGRQYAKYVQGVLVIEEDQ